MLAQNAALGNVTDKAQRAQLEPLGTIGRCKPSKSWSWFLEVDDSNVSKWIVECAAKGQIIDKFLS